MLPLELRELLRIVPSVCPDDYKHSNGEYDVEKIVLDWTVAKPFIKAPLPHPESPNAEPSIEDARAKVDPAWRKTAAPQKGRTSAEERKPSMNRYEDDNLGRQVAVAKSSSVGPREYRSANFRNEEVPEPCSPKLDVVAPSQSAEAQDNNEDPAVDLLAVPSDIVMGIVEEGMKDPSFSMPLDRYLDDMGVPANCRQPEDIPFYDIVKFLEDNYSKFDGESWFTWPGKPPVKRKAKRRALTPENAPAGATAASRRKRSRSPLMAPAGKGARVQNTGKPGPRRSRSAGKRRSRSASRRDRGFQGTSRAHNRSRNRSRSRGRRDRDEGGKGRWNDRDEGGKGKWNDRDEGGKGRWSDRDEGGKGRWSDRDESGKGRRYDRDAGGNGKWSGASGSADDSWGDWSDGGKGMWEEMWNWMMSKGWGKGGKEDSGGKSDDWGKGKGGKADDWGKRMPGSKEDDWGKRMPGAKEDDWGKWSSGRDDDRGKDAWRSGKGGREDSGRGKGGREDDVGRGKGRDDKDGKGMGRDRSGVHDERGYGRDTRDSGNKGKGRRDERDNGANDGIRKGKGDRRQDNDEESRPSSPVNDPEVQDMLCMFGEWTAHELGQLVGEGCSQGQSFNNAWRQFVRKDGNGVTDPMASTHPDLMKFLKREIKRCMEDVWLQDYINQKQCRA